MRSNGVVVEAPCFDDLACVSERIVLVLVKALVANAAVKNFDEGVLSRFAGIDRMKLHLAIAGPASHCDAR